MRSVNKVILVGNLTRDPELKQTTGGQSIVTFGIATNREWVVGNEKKSLAEYHNVAAWGTLAEICGRYLKKGKLVYVEGYLKTRSWDNPEGVKIFKTEIVATDMIMLDKRPQDEGDDYPDFLPDEHSSEEVPSDEGFDPAN
jgi:single-strand DNA-binding protein